jgi:hypothetical protein
MGVDVGTGVGIGEGVSVGGGTLGVLVGMGVSVAAGAGVKVGLGVLVGIGTGVGALAVNEVSEHPRHPNVLPKINTAMRITNRDLLIVLYTIFILLSNSLASAKHFGSCVWSSNCSGLKFHTWLKYQGFSARIIPYFTGNTKTQRSRIPSKGGSHAAGSRAWEPALLQNRDPRRLREALFSSAAGMKHSSLRLSSLKFIHYKLSGLEF